MPVKDMSGLRFTRLRVLSRAPSDSNGNARWNCLCDCGNTTVSSGFTLRNGEAKSCGCLTRDQLRTLNALMHKKPGYSERRAWTCMRQRCTNPKTKGWERYGGRGIKICERWNTFANFYADMGPKPSRMHSVERINNDGDYEPNNCRWATAKEQCRNNSRNHMVTYKGQLMPLVDAIEASASGIDRSTVQSRLGRGWTIEDAIEKPINENIWTSRRRRGK